MLQINELLKKMEEGGYDELHLSVGTEPFFKTKNKCMKEENCRISRPDLEEAFKGINNTYYNEYIQNKMFIGTHSVPSIGRYNLYAFSQRGSLVLMFKRSYNDINSVNLHISGIDDYTLTPGVTLLTGDRRRKEVAMELVNKLLDQNLIVMTAEESIKYPLKHKLGYIFQCEKDNDFKDIEDLLKMTRRIEPDVLYVEYGFDYKIMTRIFSLAANGTSIILNMPYVDEVGALDNIAEILKKEHNSAARQFITKAVSLNNGIYQIRTIKQ